MDKSYYIKMAECESSAHRLLNYSHNNTNADEMTTDFSKILQTQNYVGRCIVSANVHLKEKFQPFETVIFSHIIRFKLIYMY